MTSPVALGEFFGVTLNELLNGERLVSEQLPDAAERNVTAVLQLSEHKKRMSNRTIKILGIALTLCLTVCVYVNGFCSEVV